MSTSWGVFSASRLLNGFLYYLPSTKTLPPDSLDISKTVVPSSTHSVAIGKHAELWIGAIANKKVALKVLRGGSLSDSDFLQKFKQRLGEAVLVWRCLKHPNVSEFYGLSFNFGYMPALVLPFYGNGNVVEYVKGKGDDAKLDMVKQIAEGLNYLHENSVIHGDIRGANVLVDGGGSARICDYGLVFIIGPPDFTSIKTAGACRWTAPEIMNPAEHEDSPPKYSKRSDIYAFAMTFLEIFTGMIPFSDKDDNSVRSYVLDGGRPELPPFFGEHYRRIIQACWVAEADGRPTMKEIRKILAPTRFLNVGGTCLWSHNDMGEHRDPRSDNDTFDKVASVFSDAGNVDARRSSFTAAGRDSNCPIHFEFNFYVAGHFCIILLVLLFVIPLFSFGCSPLQG